MENTTSRTNQTYEVKGTARIPSTKVKVSAFDRDLRSELELGHEQD